MIKNHNHKWKYKNLTIVFISIIIGVILYKTESLHSFLLNLGNLGYIGAFLAGILFVSTFTVTTGALILLILAEKLSPIEIGLIAGVGAVIGDLIIFRFVKNNLTKEIQDVYSQIDGKIHVKKLFHSKYFNWMLPLIGAVIIASPLPDELGVSLIGISKLNTTKFIIISFILNSIGILLTISASAFIKP